MTSASRRTVLTGAVGLLAATATSPSFALGRAWLGVELESVDSQIKARRVLRGSPADRSDVRKGDTILSVNGQPPTSVRDMIGLIQKAGPRGTLKLALRRGEETKTVTVSLREHPGDEEVLVLDKVGSFAPDWTIGKIAAGPIEPVKSLRGKVVLLDFWATWCAACRAMVPTLNALHDRFAPQGLTVLALTDDPEGASLKAVERLKMRYAVGAETPTETLRDYFVTALPTMFLIDKKGVIRRATIGAQPETEMARSISGLLAER